VEQVEEEVLGGTDAVEGDQAGGNITTAQHTIRCPRSCSLSPSRMTWVTRLLQREAMAKESHKLLNLVRSSRRFCDLRPAT